MKTTRLLPVLSGLLLGAASAQTLDHTLVLDEPACQFTWTILTPLGEIPGVPDNDFDMSGSMDAEITAGEVDAVSVVEILQGDLHLPYIKGEIPGIILVETKIPVDMSITTQPVYLGGSSVPAASGYTGVITLTAGEVWVTVLGGGPTIIPVAGGQSDPFPVFGDVQIDPATGDIHVVHKIFVEFEMSVSGVPMFFTIDGTVVSDYDCPAGEPFCATSPNSVGPGAMIQGLGGASYSANSLTLATTGCPPNSFGLYFYGPSPIQVPVGDGFLCVGGGIYRLGIVPIDGAGRALFDVDVTTPPDPAGQVSIGEEWYYQLWYRDPGFGSAGYNFSDGLAVTWRL